jgi:hypothetical protein
MFPQRRLWRMPSSGMWCHVVLVRTDVSEERIASIIRAKRKDEVLRGVLRLLVTAKLIPITPICFTLIMEALRSSETSVLTRATQRNIPEDGILREWLVSLSGRLILVERASCAHCIGDWVFHGDSLADVEKGNFVTIRGPDATCRRNLVPTFVDRVVSRGQRGGSPTFVNLSFLDRSRYFSFNYPLIYPHKGWADPVPDPLLLIKSGSTGNRIRDLWVSSQELSQKGKP